MSAGHVRLSILIPSVLERGESLARLLAVLDPQARDSDVEVLVLVDNRRVPLPSKRNALMAMCQGDYVIHLDDDDLVTPDLVESALEATWTNPDVVAYASEVHLGDDAPFIVRTSLAYENEQLKSVGGVWQDIKRKPWHWCAWHRRVWEGCQFSGPAATEDWSWLSQVIPRSMSEVRIDRPLHKYIHDPKRSLCGT